MSGRIRHLVVYSGFRIVWQPHRVWPSGCSRVLRKTKRGDTKMAMKKKSLVSKKTAPATKRNSSKKADTTKPAASKVVSARSMAGKSIF